jgi:hypothetical protein
MKSKSSRHRENKIRIITRALIPVLLLGVLIVLVLVLQQRHRPEDSKDYIPIPDQSNVASPDFDKIENGIHVRTGFVDGEGLMTVVTHCTACHSASLVTQNRMSREGWEQTIRWMQKTQNLWELGDNEVVILDYLSAHYAPQKKGRRPNLQGIEWYKLNSQ